MGVLAKAGKIVLPDAGSVSSWDVTGVGFRPKAVLFIWADRTEEDVWAVSAGLGQGGLGLATVVNSVYPEAGPEGTGICNSLAHGMWNGGQPGMTTIIGGEHLQPDGSYSGACALSRVTIGLWAGWGTRVTAFNADGFTMKWYTNPFYMAPNGETGEGKILYYLALGGDRHFGYNSGRVGADSSWGHELGWRPDAIIQPFGTSADWVEEGMDGYLFGAWDGDYPPGDPSDALHYLNILKGQGAHRGDKNSYSWRVQEGSELYGNPSMGNYDPITLFDEVNFNGQHHARTDTGLTFSSIGGISQASNEIGQLLLGRVAARLGNFLPAAPVGYSSGVMTGSLFPPGIMAINPAAIILSSGVSGYDRTGQNMFGFLTADFQCCILWGGGIGYPATSFQSSRRCWVADATNTASPGSTRHLGTAKLTGRGFTATTTENSAGTQERVTWWAIGKRAPLDFIGTMRANVSG